jgi:hypothetical protein
MELIQTLANIADNAPLGLCLMTDGSEVKLTPQKQIDSKDFFDISEVKQTLGIDYFELVYCKNDLILVCDEEALLYGDPILNLTASMIAQRSIYGNVMVCHTDRIN